MVILSENDYLDVKLNSLIADYDYETLANLYQPIMGYAALSVYLTLVSEAKNQKISSLISHNQILNRLQMAPGDFIAARKKLEGIGLLKTVLDSKANIKVYHYQLFAPKAPAGFFDDTLLYGMLIKALGDSDANRFKNIYRFVSEEGEGKDISSSFIDAYQPDFEDPSFMKAVGKNSAIGRRSGKINSEFNYDLFFTSLSEISQINSDAFLKKEMKEIERLATLNGLSEEEAAKIVAENFDPYAGKGKHLDFEQLSYLFQRQTNYSYILNKKKTHSPNTNSGSSLLAEKINIMETTSPKDFLTLLQNGTQPASSDLRIVNDLSKKFQLNNAVINAVVDFVLLTNNNVLSRALCEKIAGSLAREDIVTTIDAMNYLKKVSHRDKKQALIKVNKEEKEINKPVKKEKKDINWDELLDDLEIDDGGNNNGKA
ncbi:MAG: DnaD domain protein [Bacilli bacterium]|nr:DnaD domain protein [Bacilli bacterium]